MKIKGVQCEELRSLWANQISSVEKEAIATLKSNPPLDADNVERVDSLAAVAWAEEHLFDRRSVVPEYELWRHALEYARGQPITVEEIQKFTRQRDSIRNEHRPYMVTTREVLEREWNIVCMAKDGIGRFAPLCANCSISNSNFGQDQRQAVERILSSRGFVTLFRGGAGTGKSYALREVKDELHTAGHAVQVIAPQRQQVIDLAVSMQLKPPLTLPSPPRGEGIRLLPLCLWRSLNGDPFSRDGLLPTHEPRICRTALETGMVCSRALQRGLQSIAERHHDRAEALYYEPRVEGSWARFATSGSWVLSLGERIEVRGVVRLNCIVTA